MSIQSASGIAVRCNLCQKHASIIRHDSNLYRNTNPPYVAIVQAEAEKIARLEGYIKLNEPEPPLVQDPDGNDNVVNRAVKHICPACLASILDGARNESPVDLDIPRVKANEQVKEKKGKRK